MFQVDRSERTEPCASQAVPCFEPLRTGLPVAREERLATSTGTADVSGFGETKAVTLA